MRLLPALRRWRAFVISMCNIVGLACSVAGVLLLFYYALPNKVPGNRGHLKLNGPQRVTGPGWEIQQERYARNAYLGLVLVLLGTALEAVPPVCTAFGSWRRRAPRNVRVADITPEQRAELKEAGEAIISAYLAAPGPDFTDNPYYKYRHEQKPAAMAWLTEQRDLRERAAEIRHRWVIAAAVFGGLAVLVGLLGWLFPLTGSPTGMVVEDAAGRAEMHSGLYEFFRDQGSIIGGAGSIIVGAAVAAFTSWLYKATRRLWKASNAQTQVLINNERPWVGPSTVAGPKKLSPGEDIAKSVFVIILNTGRAPAQQMKAQFKGLILDRGISPKEIDTTSVPAKALFPGVRDYYRPFARQPPLSETDYDAIVSGRRIAWVVGRIDYLDTAGKQRWSTIRTQWDSQHNAFVPSQTGNDAT